MWRGTCFPRHDHPFDGFCLRHRASGRKIRKEAIFALVDELPAAKMAPLSPHMSPTTIDNRGAAAPDTPGKSVCPAWRPSSLA